MHKTKEEGDELEESGKVCVCVCLTSLSGAVGADDGLNFGLRICIGRGEPPVAVAAAAAVLLS